MACRQVAKPVDADALRLYFAASSVVKENVPSFCVEKVRTVPCAEFVNVTTTLATVFPDGSVTVPAMRAVANCCACSARKEKKTNAQRIAQIVPRDLDLYKTSS